MKNCMDCGVPLTEGWKGLRCGVCIDREVDRIRKRQRDSMTNYLVRRGEKHDHGRAGMV